jgi:uncharacterized protein YrrD
MLLLGERLIGTPIMSLQVGVKIAETVAPVIDPKNLAIIAYEVDGPLLESRPSFIRIADIRELSDIGMIIDSSDELVGESDVIKIQDIRKLHFKLVGMRVIDTNGKKLGKIVDYTLDTDSFIIQQLSVHGGIISSISNTEHVIHRSQITEINDKPRSSARDHYCPKLIIVLIKRFTNIIISKPLSSEVCHQLLVIVP